MPQPKQSPSTSTPPVRADATATPSPATAPGKSTKQAVAKKAATPKRAKAKAKPAKPAPAAGKTAAAPKPAARPKAAPKGRAAAPEPRKAATPPRPAAEPAPAPEPTSEAARDEALRANLASLRDLLAGGVVLTAQRLQDALDEAVTRGRMTRHDAEDLAVGLLVAGRQQTADLTATIEQLIERGRSDLTAATVLTVETIRGSGDLVLREVDKARRAAGLGGTFPISGYDDLTVAQVRARLKDLSAADLRKVRTYERANAERATVLKAIEAVLAKR